uniref:Beta-1,3-glucosyltransferase-like n=1 Tax=Phallusia mammillata TaxID=59560 RepID=A0A6F9D827_9ASCI|nr:beta-1,3-glucosyltransferase-like [Phallusia mammillata]
MMHFQAGSYLLCLLANLYFISLCNYASGTTGSSSVLIIIRDQANDYHHKLATAKKAELDTQIKAENLNAKVILMHEEYPVEGAWTILPVLPDIARKYADEFKWFMFIEEGTAVDIKQLTTSFLTKHDPSAFKLLCRCLHDNSPTIIHHFAFVNKAIKKFKYPDFDAGWIWSTALLQKVAFNLTPETLESDFQIDTKHEIAMWLEEHHDLKVTCVKELCGGGENKKSCVTKFDKFLPDCGDKVTLDDVLVSVKTTLMFHKDRVPVVQKTWGKYVQNIRYYSNVTDLTIPTMDCGVPNTVSGHCGKMEKIILDAYETSYDWLVIADDDSIIGVSKLLKLLNCYDPNRIIVLGERYGFGLLSGYGYGYITGGGGMVMSRAAVRAWKNKGCHCPAIDSPDDMFLGQCFSLVVGVPVTHSPLFHQARPDDYADGYLGNQEPISFHKHWEVDPYEVYADWFAQEDKAMFAAPNVKPTEAPEPQVIPIPPTPTENQIKDEL